MKGDCEGCKKPATYHLTEIEGGQKIEKHYCESCPHVAGESIAASSKGHTPINELLTNFVLAHQTGMGAGPTMRDVAECEVCGLTFADFKQSGVLGCERDYTTFEKDLSPLLARAHEGASHHIGKVPARRNNPASLGTAAGAIVKKKKPDLTKLKRELENAVESEDYERAAKLRDQIRKAMAE